MDVLDSSFSQLTLNPSANLVACSPPKYNLNTTYSIRLSTDATLVQAFVPLMPGLLSSLPIALPHVNSPLIVHSPHASKLSFKQNIHEIVSNVCSGPSNTSYCHQNKNTIPVPRPTRSSRCESCFLISHDGPATLPIFNSSKPTVYPHLLVFVLVIPST